VGPRSDRQALDATERLVFRSMMAFLGWVESAASDRSNPLKRLAIAEYRLLGSVLGLSSPEESAAPAGPARDRGGRRPEGPAPAPAAEPQAGPRYPVRIRHAGAERRAVRVCAWEYAGDTSIPATIAVRFYHVEQAHRTPLEGEVAIAGRRAVTLALATPPSAPAGRWRAALCDRTGFQVGSIEIAL
jgi:hypothetical protein